MLGTTINIKGVVEDFLTPILQKICIEPTREDRIEIHRMISGNVESVASKLGGGQQGRLALTMTKEYYMTQTGYALVPLNNPGNYPPMMGNT